MIYTRCKYRMGNDKCYLDQYRKKKVKLRDKGFCLVTSQTLCDCFEQGSFYNFKKTLGMK